MYNIGLRLLVSYMPLASSRSSARARLVTPLEAERCEKRYSGSAFVPLNNILKACCNHSAHRHSSRETRAVKAASRTRADAGRHKQWPATPRKRPNKKSKTRRRA